jgi:O-antigen ligase
MVIFGLFINELYFGFNLEERILRPAVERDQETVWMRFTYWETALNNFKNFPLFGTGPNTYNVVSDFPLRRYYIRGAEQYSLNPDYGIGIHNVFIERLADTGIFGFTTFMVLVIYFAKSDFVSLIKLKKMGNDEGLKKFILFSLGSWTWILYSITDNGYGAQGLMTFFFIRGLIPHLFKLEYDKKIKKNSYRS